jgi:hypothetical protein
VDWIPQFDEKAARYERALVMQGNTAYAAGLALLMAHDPRAGDWLRRAAARWRESWDVRGSDTAPVLADGAPASLPAPLVAPTLSDAFGVGRGEESTRPG